MADELYDGTAIAVGVQSAFGTQNGTIAALSSPLDETDGIVLGDKNSGDAESGITIPDLEPIVREVARVVASFTESADAFLRTAVNNFSITLPMQGNGVTSTPTTDQAQPFSGIDAILQCIGLNGASGTDPLYVYTPSAVTNIYCTVKMWLADHSFVFNDCIVESASIVFEPGGSALLTANFKVGSLATFATGVTFPTLDYGTQTTLANPVVEGVDFDWGTGHPGDPASGFNTLTLNIDSAVEEFGDSNVATTGIRQSQTGRVFTVDGSLYVDDADSSADYDNLVATIAPTADLSFQVGTVAAPAADLNAFKVEVNNLQGKGLKYNRIGTVLVAEMTGAKATGLTASSEFTLTFN